MDQLADVSFNLLQKPPPASKRSPAAAAKGEDHHGQPSLVSLPDVVLVLLFQMLPVPDRGRLARTCSRLSTFMQCPSVWTDIFIQLHATITGGLLDVSFLGPQDSSMIEKYGAYFQRATIVFPSSRISQEVCDMLSDFTRRDIKLKLIIQLSDSIPMVAMKRSSPYEPFHNVIGMRDTFSSSTSISFEFSEDLYKFFLKTKEFYWSPKLDMFCAMLTDLVLPIEWPERTLAAIYGLCSTPTAALISNFPALTRLTLSLHNASEELLLELSDSSGRRSPLRSLVLQHVDGTESWSEAFPQLSSAAWSNLRSACPSLTVECYFACHHMPPLSQVIKRETPLVKLTVSCNEHSDTDSAHFAEVCTEHKSTLRFYSLTAGNDLSIGTQEYLDRTGWDVLL